MRLFVFALLLFFYGVKNRASGEGDAVLRNVTLRTKRF